VRSAFLLSIAIAGCTATAPPKPAATSSAKVKIDFIEDDYARALAEARSRNLPLFVDAWASWCHSCLSMREFVFPDPAIVARKNEFVWLSLDTEKPSAAAFVGAHPMEFWPTLWVIDTKTETPVLRWGGTATAAELTMLLDDARTQIAGGGGAGEAAAAYLAGNQKAAHGEIDEAIASYRAALASAPAGWPRRARVDEALSSRLHAKKDCAAVVDLALQELPKIPPGTSAKAVAQDALGCVVTVEKKAGRSPQRATILVLAETIAKDSTHALLADDRSDLYASLEDTLREVGEAARAKEVARAWAAFLEGEAARAKTPAERAVFDPQRFEAYVALEEPERAVPMLLASARDFPRDYNPPARLASAYLKMGRADDALREIERALALAYGPRKLRLYNLKADILAAKGDKAAERATVTEALAYAREVTLVGSAVRVREALERRAAQLTTP
jgi:tetratricopeptide (TPR) repeat protein